MPFQTHHIGMSGMTYRNEEHIFIGDPRERLASLDFLRQELLPTDHQSYQYRSSELPTDHQNYQYSMSPSTIIRDVDNVDSGRDTKNISIQETNNKYNQNIKPKTLKYLKNKCCIFL